MKKAFLFVMLSAAIAALMGCTNPRDLLDEAMDDASTSTASTATTDANADAGSGN